MNGFNRAKFNERWYLCIAASSSFPAESCLSEVMSEDRCLRRSRVLRVVWHEEMQFSIDLLMVVWERTARHIGDLMVSEVRNLSLEVAWRCIGYFHKEVLANFEAYPLRLCQSETVANLEWLRDETTTKTQIQSRRPGGQSVCWRAALTCGTTSHARRTWWSRAIAPAPLG